MSIPATHVFIVGVSQYSHEESVRKDVAGMGRFGSLDGPALAAWKLSEFLRNPPEGFEMTPPLGEPHLHLSPSASDLLHSASLKQWAASAAAKDANSDTVKNGLTQWQRELAENPENVALFYFAGHGVLCGRSPYMLMQDFGGKAILREAACLLADIKDCLQPAKQFPGIARGQLLVADCCLSFEIPPELRDSDPIEPMSKPARSDLLPVACDIHEIFATVPGLQGLALPGHGTLLGEAMQKALLWGAEPGGGGSEDFWQLKVTPLKEAIAHEFEVRLSQLQDDMARLQQNPDRLQGIRPYFADFGDGIESTFLAKIRGPIKTRVVLEPQPYSQNIQVMSRKQGNAISHPSTVCLPRRPASVFEIDHFENPEVEISVVPGAGVTGHPQIKTVRLKPRLHREKWNLL